MTASQRADIATYFEANCAILKLNVSKMTKWSSVRLDSVPTTDRHVMAQSEAPEVHPIHTMISTTNRTTAFNFDRFRISVQLKTDSMILLRLE